MLFQRFKKPTIPYLNGLVHMAFKTIQKAGKHSTFLKLKAPLLRMLMIKEGEEEKDLIRKGIYAYYCLFKVFPHVYGS